MGCRVDFEYNNSYKGEIYWKFMEIPLSMNDPEFRKFVERGIPLNRLEKRLRPKLGLGNEEEEEKQHDNYVNFSEEGFLGIDESLLEVIYNDWKIVEKFGTTHEEIAEALLNVIKTRKNKKFPNKRYKIQKGIILSFGSQDCPWNCERDYWEGSRIMMAYDSEKATQIDLRNADTNLFSEFSSNTPTNLTDRIAVFTELHPHLIREHYFFEGKKSPYRADPEFLIKALNLGNAKEDNSGSFFGYFKNLLSR